MINHPLLNNYLQFKSEFSNKEFMIWATVLSLSCFCWLYSFFIFGCKNYNDFIIHHLVMSMCRVFSCVVGRGCLLWPVHSLGKTLLAFALLHFVLQGQTCLLLQVSLDFLFLHSSPLWWKGHLWQVLVLEGLIGLHRTVQLQLLKHYWLGHRLGSPWYWMVWLGNKQSYCRFWDCIQVLHFRLFCWPWWLLHFFLRDSCPQ